jgi:hypothetical protein
LVINEAEAEQVRQMFSMFLRYGSGLGEAHRQPTAFRTGPAHYRNRFARNCWKHSS